MNIEQNLNHKNSSPSETKKKKKCPQKKYLIKKNIYSNK